MKIGLYSLDVEMSESKESALNKMSVSLSANDIIEDSAFFYKEIMEREQLGNTHIGSGAALVHSIAQTVKQEGIYLYYLSNPLTHWHFNETHPIKLIVLYAIQSVDSVNLKCFRKFSSLCADDELLQELIDQQYSVEAIKKYLAD
ncbi:PTS sugar transporter subunit IIA [Domibacillus enclensis]|uniref:Phosphotransferase system mannitol/fructose-specific IIA domain (Ntr-type) n=1 Tax=Domibacillus enclensis TaxID=1017273 RepID=A0A1N6XSC7_9BACI|nr:PTS sugar transporter subunit IIA [Domibacillus enclensis]OXS77416.1 hypothetical protein B1B05_11275 [Domibacillus enclensis]SIR05220.1 Phosphotransferase system mannitol/fructose-specific IIA domain (Ntr-type) [Domibacillus enclensis]